MPELEERQAKIEGILEQLEKRVSSMEMELKALRAEFIVRFERLESKVDSNFKWLVGILFTMWVTIILAILFKT